MNLTVLLESAVYSVIKLALSDFEKLLDFRFGTVLMNFQALHVLAEQERV